MTFLTMNEMEQADGLAVDYQVFQVTLRTQVVLGMTLQMIFVTKNWTLINFAGNFLLSKAICLTYCSSFCYGYCILHFLRSLL